MLTGDFCQSQEKETLSTTPWTTHPSHKTCGTCACTGCAATLTHAEAHGRTGTKAGLQLSGIQLYSPSYPEVKSSPFKGSPEKNATSGL